MNPPASPEHNLPDDVFEINEFGETIDLRYANRLDASARKAAGEIPTRTIPLSVEDDLESVDMPKRVGRYTIQTTLGRGGYGAVFRGYDNQLDRHVAIKVPLLIKEEKAAQETFLREAKQLAQLTHPGIVSVFDVGVDEDRCYIVTEFLNGRNLNEVLSKRNLRWQESVAIVAEVADALAHAHAMSTVHRDVKPANIIMVDRPEGEIPVLVDFGLAVSDAVASSDGKGVIAGTPNYMSPEQVSADATGIDGRTDIYALGVILYRLLTGQLPFRSKRIRELFYQIANDQPQPLRQLVPSLPQVLEHICLKALSKRMKDRHATAADLAQELRNLLANPDQPFLAGAADIPAPAAAVPEIEPISSITDSLSSSARRSREAERRQVSMLACSSEFFETEEFTELDPDEQHELQIDYRAICEKTLGEFGGTVVEYTSQGMLACFGFPVAFEDAAQRAVRGGLKLSDALIELGKSNKCEMLPQIAVHTGRVVAEQSGDPNSTMTISLSGADKNIAVRLGEAADPNTVVVSDYAFNLVGGYFQCESLGQQKVRGSSKPIELFQVTGESHAKHRLDLLAPKDLTPLIGRDTELSILRDRWEQAAEGMGQVVSLIGEAGLGKSRLIREIREHVAKTDPDAALVELRCATYHQNSGLYPFSEFFERMLEAKRDATQAEKLDSLIEFLAEFDLEGPDTLPLFATLMSIPLDSRYPRLNLNPQKAKELTQQVLLEWLRRFAAKQPVLFIIEDLHWVDPSTLELLGLLMDGGFQESILSIFTFRPEFTTPWTSAAHQTQIALNRLTRRQVGQLIREQTGISNLSDDVVDQIVERTDGVPLFVEEFTRVIQEADDLQDVDGSVTLSKERTFVIDSIPASLHDLLISRLDRMDSLHDVVQLGAALGREFSYELICAVSSVDESALNLELDKLVHAEVLFEKGKRPESTFIFKHALIQDAAYDSLLKKKRQQFHQQIGLTLEESFTQTTESQPELLAEHFTLANDIEKAMEYWLKAGVRAQGLFANIEAISHLEKGLELLEDVPDSPERSGLELQFKLPLSAVLMGAKGYAAPEVEPIQERAIEICRSRNLPFLFGVMEANWSWLFIRCRFDSAFARSKELIAMGESSKDEGHLTEAHWTHSCTSLYHGDFEDAITHGNKVMETWDPLQSAEYAKLTQQNSGPLAMSCVGVSLWKTGYPDQAVVKVQEALDLSLEIKDVFTQVIMEWKMGQVGECSRDAERAMTYGKRCVAIAEAQSFVWWHALGTCCQGVALHFQGKHKEAIKALREGMAMSQATGAGILFVKYKSFLADALWQVDKQADAWKTLNDAFALLEKGERYFEAELHRIKGDFLFDEGHHDQAEGAYRTAIEIAQRQKSKSYELRAVLQLCRILQESGRTEEARNMLSEIYNWFTEGFETVDLVAAKKLLEHL